MNIGTGTFTGRNGYQLNGTFKLTRDSSATVQFETSEDFFFGNNSGGGTPAPGFAFFAGDPTGLPNKTVGAVANQTDFLRIADQAVAVSGKQTGSVPDTISLAEFDTVFLWCYSVPFVLGVGRIVSGVQDGN
jgi:hypothetical protein